MDKFAVTEVNYEAINECHRTDFLQAINECHQMVDFLQAWINHHRKPNAWQSTTDTLEDRAAAFAELVKGVK